MASDDFDPKRPTHIIDGQRTTLANGAAAGPIVIPEIAINDILISVQSQDRTTGVVADLLSEFTISDADEIDNTGGTATTGDNLYVRWFDRDWLEQEFFTPG